MSNWNLPTITSGYLDFVTEMNDKFVDAGTIGYGAPTNLPEHAMRFNRSTNIFEEWVANAWIPKVIGIAGGGTGGSDPASARAALGLGSMAVQNSNAVNITGGSITGVNLNGDAITSGIVALARGGTGASLALGAAGTVMMSNGSVVAFLPGTSITELNAGALTVGTVPLARLSGVGLLAAANQWTGHNSFLAGASFAETLNINGAYPQTILTNTTGAINEKRMILMNYLGGFYVQYQFDDGTPKANPFYITPTGVLNGVASGLTAINGSNIDRGMVGAAFLGAGAAHAGTVLYGDNVWRAPAAAGGIPSGLVAMFDVACPVGWTRYAQMDNRVPLGHPQPGLTGGAADHTHGVGGNTGNAGTHRHGFGVHVMSGNNNAAQNNVGPGSGLSLAPNPHQHSVDFDGETADNGDHAHSINLGTSAASSYPPYYTLVYCRKD
jgi:hypothetical protein